MSASALRGRPWLASATMPADGGDAIMATARLSELAGVWGGRAPRGRGSRACGGRAPAAMLLAVAIVVGWSFSASAGQGFLERDGGVTSAYPYGYSDGGQESPEEPAGRWELPGPFDLLARDPLVQAAVFGPTYRNQEARTEVGGAMAYVNSRWAVPFQFSAEGTWVRLKRQPSNNRNFRQFRLAGDAEVWQRSSQYEGTAVALTGFFENRNQTFSTLETGIAVTQVIGRRWSITGNAFWRRGWNVGGPTLDAPVGAFGASYNFGAGVRFGGFYELYNKVFFSDDWGMFLSYQFLPWAEAIVDGGKFQFVRVRLLFTIPLERG